MTRNTALTWTRALTATLLIVIGVVALCAALTAHWMETVLLDNRTFMAATGPLLSDSATLEHTADRVTDELLSRMDLRALAEANVTDVLKPMIEGIATEFESFVRTQVSTAVNSKGFIALGISRLQAWHLAFARSVTTPDSTDALQDTTLRVTLGPYVDLLAGKSEQPLVRYVLERLPDSLRNAQVAVLDARPFANRLPALRALSRARLYLPWIAVAALAIGLLVAPRKRFAGLGIGVALGVSGAVLRTLIIDEGQRSAELVRTSMGASPTASGLAIETLTAPLLEWSGWVVNAGIVIALIGLILLLLQQNRTVTPDRTDQE